jgi:hypothetical protein
VPPDDGIRDPNALRWVEAGVSGLPRQREWDDTTIAEVPLLEGSEETELDFRILADGSVVGDVSGDAVVELTRDLGVEPPYAARAVRRSAREWTVGALAIESELVELPGGADALSLEVGVPPEGESMYFVDGEMLAEPPEGAAADALAELERRGAERFQAFVARADRLEDGRWELTVDPL